MYEREELQAEIGEVGEALSKPVTAYLIGGGAMSLAGLKAATKDIDVVVQDAASLTRLSDALKAIGYTSSRDLPASTPRLGPQPISTARMRPGGTSTSVRSATACCCPPA
jgi:hypothetical protein